MALYADNGSINITVVDGTTLTGLYAADGSWNCVVAPGDAWVGMNHPCGAYWITVFAGDGPMPFYAADGSWNVVEGTNVTVVGGSLGGGGGTDPDNALALVTELLTLGADSSNVLTLGP